jgi:hypothetical protein
MSKTITIEVDNENSPEDTVKEVLRLLEQGYTSGIDPTWDIVENND